MASINSLDKFQETLNKMAALILATANKATTGPAWKSAYWEYRGTMGGAGFSKFRIEIATGALLDTVEEPLEITALYLDLVKAKVKPMGRKKWYVFLMTVLQDGSSNVTFGYDKKALGDKSFFES